MFEQGDMVKGDGDMKQVRARLGQDNDGESNNNDHVRKTKSADELRSCLYDGTSGLVIGNGLPLFVPKSYLYVLPTTNKGRHP